MKERTISISNNEIFSMVAPTAELSHQVDVQNTLPIEHEPVGVRVAGKRKNFRLLYLTITLQR